MSTTTVPLNRVETWRLDDGTIEERVYLDGRLVDRRRTPPAGTAPQRHPAVFSPPEARA